MLEELPPGDDLEMLEPWEDDEGPVTVALEQSGEGGGEYDVKLTVSVAEMEKKAVPDAIEGPLRRAAATHGAALRWQRVLVEFVGDAMIPTAAKGCVTDALADAKTRSITIQRGYPDELVHEAEPPQAKVAVTADGVHVRVDVDTADLDAVDLPFALRSALAEVVTSAQGKEFELRFDGGPQPDAEVTEVLRHALAGAGATRIALGYRDGSQVIYDRVLEERVVVSAASSADVDRDTDLVVTPAGEDDETCLGLGLALPRRRDLIAGQRVRARFVGRAPTAGELDCLCSLAGELQPQRLELRGEGGGGGGGGESVDLLWPALLHVAGDGGAATIGVEENGRGHAALVAAFSREVAGHAEQLSGQAVTVDWPAGFGVDADLERACVQGGLVPLQPASVAYSFAGGEREPVLPAPLTLRATDVGGGPGSVVELNVGSSKPAELIRAIERRLRAVGDLVGQRVEVHVVGEGSVSRTVRRALRDGLEAAGVAAALIDDHGSRQVVLPRLLTAEPIEGGEVRITARAAGRDDDQVGAAAKVELAELEVGSGARVRLAGAAAQDALLAALVEQGVEAVVVDGDDGVQLYPPLFTAPERDGGAVTIKAGAVGADAALLRQVERELPSILADLGDMGGIEVTLAWPGAAGPDVAPVARALELMMANPPDRLMLTTGDGPPDQLHPEVVYAPVGVLGRRDAGSPPMLMLGVDLIKAAKAITAAENALTELAADLEGRRVLVVFRDGEVDAAAPAEHPMVRAVRARLESLVAALLVFRPAGRAGPSHFEVVHSALEGMVVGIKMRDPR